MPDASGLEETFSVCADICTDRHCAYGGFFFGALLCLSAVTAGVGVLYIGSIILFDCCSQVDRKDPLRRASFAEFTLLTAHLNK